MKFRTREEIEQSLIAAMKLVADNKATALLKTERKALARSVSYNRQSPKRKSRKYSLKYSYGLSLEQFNVMVKAQDNLCAVCKQIMGMPCVDHDHITDKIRGLLCQGCNKGLGFFKESIESLNSAVLYLKYHENISKS